jgi:protein-disulfide isomerase
VPPIDPKTDHIRGNKDATVAVIEYSDFECPFCKSVFPTYQQVMQTYGDKVMWVYRQFPLSFHQNAQKEAEASECIAELGGNDAFWKYNDYVFSHTTSNGTGFALDQLPVAAKQAGVDVTKFQSCLDSGKYQKQVQNSETAATAAGVDGTPGNFVYNLKTKESTPLIGAVPFANFKTAIDAALAK